MKSKSIYHIESGVVHQHLGKHWIIASGNRRTSFIRKNVVNKGRLEKSVTNFTENVDKLLF